MSRSLILSNFLIWGWVRNDYIWLCIIFLDMYSLSCRGGYDWSKKSGDVSALALAQGGNALGLGR